MSKLTTLAKVAAIMPPALLLEGTGAILGSTGKGLEWLGRKCQVGCDKLYEKAGSSYRHHRSKFIADMAKVLAERETPFQRVNELSKSDWVAILMTTLEDDPEKVDGLRADMEKSVVKTSSAFATKLAALAAGVVESEPEQYIGLMAMLGDEEALQKMEAEAKAEAKAEAEAGKAEPVVGPFPTPDPQPTY